MMLQAMIREVTERSYVKKDQTKATEHQLTVETSAPVAMLTVEIRREHVSLIDTYRTLQGKTVLLPVGTNLIAPQGGKTFTPFLKWLTSGDGKPVQLAAVRAA